MLSRLVLLARGRHAERGGESRIRLDRQGSSALRSPLNFSGHQPAHHPMRLLKLRNRHTFAIAVRGPHIPWSEYNNLFRYRCEHTCLRPERNCGRLKSRSSFNRLHQRSTRRRFESRLLPQHLNQTPKISIRRAKLLNQPFNRIQHKIISGHRTPLNQDLAPARDDVLRRPTLNCPHIQSCIRRLKRIIPLILQPLRKLLQYNNHSRRRKDR